MCLQTPVLQKLETGELLGLAGWQPNWKNVSLRERFCCKGYRRVLNTLLWPTQYICTYNTHNTQSYKERKNITKAVQLNTLNKAYYFVSVKKLFCVWSCPLLCMSHSSPINTFYRCVNWGLENLHSTASLWCLPNPIAWNGRNINSTSTEVVLEDDNCLIWKEYLVSNGW